MEDKFLSLKTAMAQCVQEGHLPGAIVGICVDGKEICRYNIGYNDGAIFRIASMTKPITAVACLICQDMGLLDINDRIDKYIPFLQINKVGKMENGKVVFDKISNTPIKIKDILTHSSGLGSGDVGQKQTDNRKKPRSLKQTVKAYKDWYLDFEPNSSQMYSGVIALDIVARIVEIVSGIKYFDFLKKYIFDPLDMKDTTYKLNKEQKSRLVHMFERDWENDKIYQKDFSNYSGFDCFLEGYPSGSAGLFSTYDDYIKFANMLANKGEYNGKRILKEETVELMKTARYEKEVVNSDASYWGLTVFVRGATDKENQPLSKGCFGWSGAFTSHFFVNTDTNVSALLMTNCNNVNGGGYSNFTIFERAVHDLVYNGEK